MKARNFIEEKDKYKMKLKEIQERQDPLDTFLLGVFSPRTLFPSARSRLHAGESLGYKDLSVGCSGVTGRNSTTDAVLIARNRCLQLSCHLGDLPVRSSFTLHFRARVVFNSFAIHPIFQSTYLLSFQDTLCLHRLKYPYRQILIAR